MPLFDHIISLSVILFIHDRLVLYLYIFLFDHNKNNHNSRACFAMMPDLSVVSKKVITWFARICCRMAKGNSSTAAAAAACACRRAACGNMCANARSNKRCCIRPRNMYAAARSICLNL